MIIGGKEFEQIVIIGPGDDSEVVTADDNREVIAVISDDGEIIVKNGYEVRMTPAL